MREEEERAMRERERERDEVSLVYWNSMFESIIPKITLSVIHLCIIIIYEYLHL